MMFINFTLGILLIIQEEKCLLPYQPSDVLFATPETKSTFNQSYDEYGDHFTDDISSDAMKQLFADMGNINDKERLGTKDIMEIEQRYFEGDRKRSLFRRCRYENVL